MKLGIDILGFNFFRIPPLSVSVSLIVAPKFIDLLFLYRVFEDWIFGSSADIYSFINFLGFK